MTNYVYGTSVGGITPEIYRNDLLRAVIYPDSDDPTDLSGNGTDGVYDRVEYKYNRQGERIELKDQNGSVHEFTCDGLGRLLKDTVFRHAGCVAVALLTAGARAQHPDTIKDS